MYHGVAVCALAKAYYLFTKLELLVSESFDRNVELILAESHNECQISYKNYFKINSEEGMKFCLQLEDQLIEKFDTLETSKIHNGINIMKKKEYKKGDQNSAGSFRYRERSSGKAISLLIEHSIIQLPQVLPQIKS